MALEDQARQCEGGPGSVREDHGRKDDKRLGMWVVASKIWKGEGNKLSPTACGREHTLSIPEF